MCLAIPGRVVQIVDDETRLAKVDEEEAQATLALLQQMGEAYEQELADLKASAI